MKEAMMEIIGIEIRQIVEGRVATLPSETVVHVADGVAVGWVGIIRGILCVTTMKAVVVVGNGTDSEPWGGVILRGVE